MKLATYTPQVQRNTINAQVEAPAAQALANIGQMQNNTLKGFAGIAAKLAEERQVTDVTAAQTEYAKRVSDMLYNEENGLMNRQLANADGVSLAYQDGERKIREDIQKQFKLSGKGLNTFNVMCDKDAAGHWGRLNQYEFNEGQKNKKIVTDNALLQIGNEAQALYNDVSMMNDALGKMRATIDANYYNMGKDYCEAYFRQSAANLVTSSLNVAVRKNDMAGAETIMSKFGYLVPPSQLSTYAKAVQEYIKENQQIARTQSLYQTYGNDVRGAFAAIDNEASADIPESGSMEEQAMAAARYVEARTGIPAAIIYGQWVHESTYHGKAFNSPLARENLNFGGLTQVEPNGEENRQRDGGTNYYKMYKSVGEFAEDYVNSFLKRYDFTGVTIKTPEDWARFLKKQGYYTGYGDTEEEKIAGYAAGIASGMRGYNPNALLSDNISIQKQKDDYLKYLSRENQINNIIESDKIRQADEMLAADPNADPRSIAMSIAGTDVKLAKTITDYLTQKKDKIRQKGLPIAAMDEVTRMLMYDDAFQSEGNLIAYMQSQGFNDTQISKGRELWKNRLDGTGPFAIRGYKSYVDAAIQKSGNMAKDKTYEIELNQFGLDFIRSFRRKNHREPTSEELQEALTNKYNSTKLVLNTDGQQVSFAPRELTRKSIVSADVATWREEDPNNPGKFIEHEIPGMIRVEYRDGTVVNMPISQYREDVLKQSASGNGWFGSSEKPSYDVGNATP